MSEAGSAWRTGQKSKSIILTQWEEEECAKLCWDTERGTTKHPCLVWSGVSEMCPREGITPELGLGGETAKAGGRHVSQEAMRGMRPGGEGVQTADSEVGLQHSWDLCRRQGDPSQAGAIVQGTEAEGPGQASGGGCRVGTRFENCRRQSHRIW